MDKRPYRLTDWQSEATSFRRSILQSILSSSFLDIKAGGMKFLAASLYI